MSEAGQGRTMAELRDRLAGSLHDGLVRFGFRDEAEKADVVEHLLYEISAAGFVVVDRERYEKQQRILADALRWISGEHGGRDLEWVLDELDAVPVDLDDEEAARYRVVPRGAIVLVPAEGEHLLPGFNPDDYDLDDGEVKE